MEGGTEAFPELGRQCQNSDCHQLDFLPFTCDSCQKGHLIEPGNLRCCERGGSVVEKCYYATMSGAVFPFNSVIGKVAKRAMEIAVSDVNADPTILNGTVLNLIMEDSSYNPFLGSIKPFQVLENDIIAIMGPQSSTVAHVISQIANGVHVPLLSYDATDPTLSSLQFPYFLRTTHSDSFRMTAMADLIDFYGWKQVIAIFTDNDYGRNGASFLGDKLARKMCRISYKLPLPVEFDPDYIIEILNEARQSRKLSNFVNSLCS